MKQRRNENKGWDVACLLDRYDANVLNRMRELIKKCTAKCNKHGLGVGGGVRKAGYWTVLDVLSVWSLMVDLWSSGRAATSAHSDTRLIAQRE